MLKVTKSLPLGLTAIVKVNYTKQAGLVVTADLKRKPKRKR